MIQFVPVVYASGEEVGEKENFNISALAYTSREFDESKCLDEQFQKSRLDKDNGTEVVYINNLYVKTNQTRSHRTVGLRNPRVEEKEKMCQDEEDDE
ncbi:unnamed protein product [Cuscuta campestris]|uniref:Uncharacterized protein n=1 Tax=Cuscuta campestris TaxID=132261 RepID=A0A484KXD2_9ASTE|nr:unnamed protein product [Cuscuta campestris]